MMTPTNRVTNHNKNIAYHSLPNSPSSLNMKQTNTTATTSGGSNTTTNANAVVIYSSRYLQIGLILIVVFVLIIDGIAIVSHSNLFETILSQDGNGSNRKLLQQPPPSPSQLPNGGRIQHHLASSEEYYLRVPPSQQQVPTEPKIVWLLSFPNSGTSYTSQLVRELTNTITASNYADETPSGQEGFIEPVYDDQIHGPFWIHPEEPVTPLDASPASKIITNTIPALDVDYVEPTQYVLTKTHCGMRCTVCPPEKYTESSYSFRRRCLTTKWVQEREDGTYERIFGEYKADRVVKAVHLIRNPFDNIISRFHLDHEIIGRKANMYEKSRDGFRSYCTSIDTLYSINEDRVHFLDAEILQILRKVPCHEEFIRYVEWHNLAFSTADDLRLPTYVLQYEWYSNTSRYDTTVTELLSFLGFTDPPIGVPAPFRPSVIYEYFTNEEKMALKQAYQMMSSTQTWAHISHYFTSLNDGEDNNNIKNAVVSAY